MASLGSASPERSPVTFAAPFASGRLDEAPPPPEVTTNGKSPADAAPEPLSGSKTSTARLGTNGTEEARPTAVMLGHWHQRTWDLANQLNVDGRCRCVGAVTDMMDALVVLRAAIPAVEILICSSYYNLEDVQEALLEYDNDIKILIAPTNLMNTGGAVAVAEWAGNMIDAKSFQHKTASLNSTGYMRRLSQNSHGSGGGY